MKLHLLILLFLSFFGLTSGFANNTKTMNLEDSSKVANKEELVVLWTSGDPDVAKKMVFMYTFNAKKNGWWEKITLVIWGPSSKLLTEDVELQEYIAKMQEEGINVVACKACADMYGVSDQLANFNIDVKYMGIPLTEFIKSNQHHVITF